MLRPPTLRQIAASLLIAAAFALPIWLARGGHLTGREVIVIGAGFVAGSIAAFLVLRRY